jgi:MFS superfamily sulfate permease-like transporter
MLFAVVLAILRFVRLVSRPKLEILGEVPGFPGFHSLDRHPEAITTPGVMLMRFNAPIVFFNSPYFKRSVIAAADAAGGTLKWLVLDLIPIPLIDATGLYTVEEVADTLRNRGVVLAAAGRQTEWRLWAESQQRTPEDRKILIYPTFCEAISAYRRAEGISAGHTEETNPD